MRQTIDIPRFFFLSSAVISALIVILVFGFIFFTAVPVFEKEGVGFLTGTTWNYETHEYGILYYIVGTLVLTVVAMAIACPLGVLTAIFLAEWAPVWLERIMRPLIELLVGIPSVVYGIFGFFVLERVFRYHVDPFIDATLGSVIPIFRDPDPSSGISILLAATVLAIMVLPTITILVQEAMLSVPREYREGSLALGATKWETIKKVVIPVAVPGLLTGIVLGFMRAMGETMAVAMIVGNSARIPSSILDSGYPMTSKILNDIGYWVSNDEARSALFGIAVVLFCVEIVFVALIRYAGDRLRMDKR
ncbi:phosphate ABC transporter permease subunit PstC [Methanoculleus sp.]|jgi:phosphate transport system permease protein|uniref:phosphate ABC transporter permease subunit PstC n=1 Tax=Methanoculleus sp. TaxID=90427 RepID=UPI001BD3E95B|nr:phosphate ABC transporter permease subunit PstC [Methanoculleus sp.]